MKSKKVNPNPAKRYLVWLRNNKDTSTRAYAVVESIAAHIGELRAFIHNQPNTAFAMFPEDWTLCYLPIPDASFLGTLPTEVPFTTWTKGE